jgi:hypothetical protein
MGWNKTKEKWSGIQHVFHIGVSSDATHALNWPFLVHILDLFVWSLANGPSRTMPCCIGEADCTHGSYESGLRNPLDFALQIWCDSCEFV